MVIWFIVAIICSFIGFSMGEKRSIGGQSGAIIGLLLGFIGVVILLFIPEKKEQMGRALNNDFDNVDNKVHEIFFPNDDKVSELAKWHDLLVKGAITEEEYQKEKEKIMDKEE